MGRNVYIRAKLSQYDRFLLRHIDETYPPYLKHIQQRILKDVWTQIDNTKAPYLWKLARYYCQTWMWYSSLALWGSMHTLETKKCLKTYLELPQQYTDRYVLEKCGDISPSGNTRLIYYEVIGRGHDYTT